MAQDAVTKRTDKRATSTCSLCKDPKTTPPGAEWYDYRVRGTTLVICMVCAKQIANATNPER